MKKKVKIIQMLWGKRWYSNRIGDEIDVIEVSGNDPYFFIACENGFPILKVDCQIINSNQFV